MSFSRRRFLSLAGVTMVSPLEAFCARVTRGQARIGIGYAAIKPKLPVNYRELTSTVIGDLSRIPPTVLCSLFNIWGIAYLPTC
ncbi:hypothetical protein CEN50_12425 [Fischerella thermalis CCMEE 5268]|uniref:Uncharacterized protein n=1 Tax=Fischerella thermalis CCMEE 5268 TaxID=2019662 RepID=A0A2N6KG04_9CYAN|nr:hypothetical protein [Fischerella thermalis]PLZ98160.1 hypothetical protein CEN50_12425 [Fischerella thermalis CCMEE 5268]